MTWVTTLFRRHWKYGAVTGATDAGTRVHRALTISAARLKGAFIAVLTLLQWMQVLVPVQEHHWHQIAKTLTCNTSCIWTWNQWFFLQGRELLMLKGCLRFLSLQPWECFVFDYLCNWLSGFTFTVFVDCFLRLTLRLIFSFLSLDKGLVKESREASFPEVSYFPKFDAGFAVGPIYFLLVGEEQKW